MMSSGRVVCRLNTVLNHIRFRPMSSFNYPKLPQVTLNLEKAEAEVIVPGYSYGDLDRMGNVAADRCGWMVEQAVISALFPEQPSPTKFFDLAPNQLIFLVAAEHHLTADFYDKAHQMQPLRCSYKVLNVGRTYHLEHVKFVSTATNKLIQESFFHNVTVDKQTHKPSPLSDTFKDKVANITGTAEHAKVTPFAKADETQCVKYKVQWSNTDTYYHSNQSEYIRYITDVIAELSLAGKLKFLKGDLAKYKIKNWKQLYQGESTPGDELDVHVWENDQDPLTVQCHIEKEGQTVHQCQVTFEN